MDNTKEKADELYKRGLFIFGKPLDREDLKLLTGLWKEALELYRELGDENRVNEIETSLTKIYRQAAISNGQDTESLDPTSSTIAPAFNEWKTFLKIGCYGFGGPMAVFSLLQDELVHRKKVLTHQDFLEGAVLGDILPGPVTMDIVTYTGYKLKKWYGAFISTLAFILPSFILMEILAMYYDDFSVIPKIENLFRCLGAAVVGIIVSVGLKLGEIEITDYRGTGILIWAFASELIFKFDIVVVVGLAGVVGIMLYNVPPPPEGIEKEIGIYEE